MFNIDTRVETYYCNVVFMALGEFLLSLDRGARAEGNSRQLPLGREGSSCTAKTSLKLALAYEIHVGFAV